MPSFPDRLRHFAESWNRMNADAMRKYFESQSEALRDFAEANQELFESLQNASDLQGAAAAQQAFMQRLQANAAEAFAKQQQIAREAAEEAQRVIQTLFDQDAGDSGASSEGDQPSP